MTDSYSSFATYLFRDSISISINIYKPKDSPSCSWRRVELNVLILRHINWSRLSPQPPFPRKLIARHIITSCQDNNSFYLVYNIDCKRFLYFLPFGNFTFFFACAVVTMRFFGYRKGLAFSRIACTFFTTFSVSHCAFLWWTPLKDGTNRNYTNIHFIFCIFQKTKFSIS